MVCLVSVQSRGACLIQSRFESFEAWPECAHHFCLVVNLECGPAARRSPDRIKYFDNAIFPRLVLAQVVFIFESLNLQLLGAHCAQWKKLPARAYLHALLTICVNLHFVTEICALQTRRRPKPVCPLCRAIGSELVIGMSWIFNGCSLLTGASTTSSTSSRTSGFEEK